MFNKIKTHNGFMHKKRTPNSLGAVFGRRLKELRKSHQMSQHEMAEESGIPRAIIAYYEATVENPTMEAIQKVAAFFEVPPETLISATPATAIPATGEDRRPKRPLSRIEQQVARIKNLSPHKQRMISNIIDVALDTK